MKWIKAIFLFLVVASIIVISLYTPNILFKNFDNMNIESREEIESDDDLIFNQPTAQLSDQLKGVNEYSSKVAVEISEDEISKVTNYVKDKLIASNLFFDAFGITAPKNKVKMLTSSVEEYLYISTRTDIPSFTAYDVNITTESYDITATLSENNFDFLKLTIVSAYDIPFDMKQVDIIMKLVRYLYPEYDVSFGYNYSSDILTNGYISFAESDAVAEDSTTSEYSDKTTPNYTLDYILNKADIINITIYVSLGQNKIEFNSKQ